MRSVPEEVVVLVDERGQSIGTAPKATVHTDDTPLHRAFSCHVIGPDGRVLVTRRALSKRTWPGTWTNSFCGHPAPDESDHDAMVRRARDELGLEITVSGPALPDFRYRAVDASGVVENEICPVYFASAEADPVVNPDEVMDWQWVAPEQLAAALAATPWAFSPWLVWQARELSTAGEAVSAGAWKVDGR